jgi:hypothetical protein
MNKLQTRDLIGGKMIETVSILDLRNSYEDLRTRVAQLGRFL